MARNSSAALPTYRTSSSIAARRPFVIAHAASGFHSIPPPGPGRHVPAPSTMTPDPVSASSASSEPARGAGAMDRSLERSSGGLAQPTARADPVDADAD